MWVVVTLGIASILLFIFVLLQQNTINRLRCSQEQSIANFFWQNFPAFSYALDEKDNCHLIKQYKKDVIIRGADPEIRLEFKGVNKSNNPSSGIKIRLAADSETTLEALQCKTEDLINAPGKKRDAMVSYNRRAKFADVSANFLVPCKNDESFDVAIYYFWPSSLYLSRDYIHYRTDQFTKGVEEFESTLLFDVEPIYVLPYYIVDLAKRELTLAKAKITVSENKKEYKTVIDKPSHPVVIVFERPITENKCPPTK